MKFHRVRPEHNSLAWLNIIETWWRSSLFFSVRGALLREKRNSHAECDVFGTPSEHLRNMVHDAQHDNANQENTMNTNSLELLADWTARLYSGTLCYSTSRIPSLALYLYIFIYVFYICTSCFFLFSCMYRSRAALRVYVHMYTSMYNCSCSE